eukprot:358504-Chlamydomonas_euryale.AAC.6
MTRKPAAAAAAAAPAAQFARPAAVFACAVAALPADDTDLAAAASALRRTGPCRNWQARWRRAAAAAAHTRSRRCRYGCGVQSPRPKTPRASECGAPASSRWSRSGALVCPFAWTLCCGSAPPSCGKHNVSPLRRPSLDALLLYPCVLRPALRQSPTYGCALGLPPLPSNPPFWPLSSIPIH